MATRSESTGVREAARKAAAPFWRRVEESGLDRFFLDRLLRALLRRWREDRFARVRQGGVHGDARAELARVFIDLEVTPAGEVASGPQKRKNERIVASWMRPVQARARARRRRSFPAAEANVPLEVVLGGPGQGKSTVGRFLVLVHAAVLLLTSPLEGIVPPAEIAHLEALLEGLSAEEIDLPREVRLPVWIELRELADGLLRDEESERDPLASMFRWYAITELREAADAGPLETALQSLPWVMVLDGLDEVPPARGRALVHACVQEIRRRFRLGGGRLIATSRPQSYDREVFGDDLVERTLLPLSRERAELYSERFLASMFPEEEGRRAALLRQMQKALASASTAALMTNPLLVTIMMAIVMHQGQPSDRRWTLFKEYYETLYKRETERDTYASDTLREHGPVIAAVHRHVGMTLQARSEEAEGVSALLPEHELRAIIRAHLSDSHSPDEVPALTDEILRAAEQRLVLLVQSQEGMYGFDLRSFQEMMAAWQLVSLPEAQSEALLRHIAPLDAWRNVVLFAIGYFYAQSSPIGWERSVGLCARLDNAVAGEELGSERDEEGFRCAIPGARLALPGARLALSVLGDAPYGKASKPRHALFDAAIALLGVPPGSIHADLAARLWEVDPERLLAALDNTLSDPRRSESAWVTLLALPDEERVNALAERHWPEEDGARRAIVRSYSDLIRRRFRGRFEGSRWLSRKIASDLSVAAPQELFLLLAPPEREQVSTNDLPYLSIEFQVQDGDFAFSWYLGTARRHRYVSPEALRKIPSTEAWSVSYAASMLPQEVSAVPLADALKHLADQWNDRSAWTWNYPPWPLLTCLMAAQTAEELLAIAGRLRRGELGDGKRWQDIEAMFGSPRLEDFQALAASADPLRSILVEGIVAPLDTNHETSVIFSNDGSLNRCHLRNMAELSRSTGTAWVQRMIAQLTLDMLDRAHFPAQSSGPDEWPSIRELSDLVNMAETRLSLYWLPVLRPSLSPLDLANILMRTTAQIVPTSAVYHWAEPPAYALYSLVEPLINVLRASPDSPRLQRALVVTLQFCARHWALPEIRAEIIGDTLDAWLLRCISGQATRNDAPVIARLLATDDETELRSSFQLLAAYPYSAALLHPILEALLTLPDAPATLRGAAVEFLAHKIAAAPAGLASPDRWRRAGLPEPPPMPHTPEPPERPGAHLTSIEINNIRAFPQQFSVEIPPTPGPGQWLVFLGENAMGKTTLLRAVAMALASPSEVAAVPSNLEAPLRRDPSRDGVIRVRTTDDRDLVTTVSGPAGDERITVASEDTARPWVVGYGCRRGSAISGTDMDNAFAPFRDLDNLFDRPRGVLRASGWLKELQRLARNNGARSRTAFEAAREALRTVLLGAESIRVENEVFVDFADRRQVPLTQLSDGYLTTAGWIVDLMARWLKRNESKKTISDTFYREMEGVVLLDEIDLHLHPRWQERVIEDVRGLFPRMTFLATTHHPLTLRGARKGEVFVLGDHEGTGAISALQRDIPPGTRVDQLLTGEWFNRPSAIVDAETRQWLDEHQQLLSQRVKAGDPRRKSLETKLRERLGGYADTSLERLAANIVAQHLDKDLPEPSARKREEVRKRVLSILERRDKRRNLKRG